jgi:1-acyl-sn-glycerol-3-phosphate acyltransferase
MTSKGICIFPEGSRSFSTELLEFKPASFKFPQKFYLPIVPVTIAGTLQARK